MKSLEEVLGTTFPNEKRKLIMNLGYTMSWIRSRYTEFLKPYGISTQQLNIMRISRGAGDWLPMSTIKERMVEKAPNATRIADKLVAKELIERRRCEDDRRVVFVKVTQKGLDLLADFDIENDKVGFRFTDNITDEEAKLVSSILDKLRGDAKENLS